MVWNQCTKCGVIFDNDWNECPVKCVDTQTQQIELSLQEIKERQDIFYVKDQAWFASLLASSL